MSELGVALRRWRERLTPADVGLSTSSSRRARGLRREELAELAHISVDYVARLEQGRVGTPSIQVIESLAAALLLSDENRNLLFELAGRVPHQNRMRTELTPSVQRLLEQLQSPVCVYDAVCVNAHRNRQHLTSGCDRRKRQHLTNTCLAWLSCLGFLGRDGWAGREKGADRHGAVE